MRTLENFQEEQNLKECIVGGEKISSYDYNGESVRRDVYDTDTNIMTIYKN